MPSSRRFALTLASAFATIVLVGPSASSADSGSTRLLVKFSPRASAQARASALAHASASAVGSIRDLDVTIATVPSSRAAAALSSLHGNRDVAFAELDRTLQPQEQLPNDPYFLNSGAWNLGGGAWGWYATHTTQAWDITQGDPNVVIAIVDTGIKTSGLADFAGQIASTWNVLNNSTDATSNAGDHGTYVAGVAALAAGNGAGNAGYCPKCRLMIVQAGTDSGASLSNLASALTYAADHGARVANLSWAGTSDSSTLQSAINYAHNKGLVVTAAAGNSNCDCVNYPAGDQNVLSVGGVADASGTKQGDSNYGTWVDVAAPEGNLTAWPTINGAPGYASVGGTSVAAPAVAGIAGLLFSYNPSLTNVQVEQALESSAAPVKFTVTYGRVDALAALQSLGASDPQAASAPVEVAAPQIYYQTGNSWTSLAPLGNAPQVGQVLVRGVGGWTGSAGLAVSGLQWQRCSTSGTSCTSVGNLGTYTVQSADTGYAIKLSFSVGNSLGSVATSVVTQPVGGSATVTAPTNTAPPAITGTAQAGQTEAAGTGSWSGSPTSYAYQWKDCDSGGNNCLAIGGATSSAYTAQATDVGSTLRVAVTATNSAGSSTATSAATAAVASAPVSVSPPANISAPAVSGTAQAGQTLAASTGTWSGSPTSFAFQWTKCDGSGSTCSAIGGATGSTYAAQAADVGFTLRVAVTATNSGGSSTAASLATTLVASAPVTVSPPANASAPAVSGTAQAGQTLAAGTGTWSGSPTGYAFQWKKCDNAGNNCATIGGATGSTYTAQGADVGFTLRVAVTASNSGGSSTAASAPTAAVTSAPSPPSTTTTTFSGSLNPQNPSRSYTVKVGSGLADAKLSFSKCNTLTLGLSTGTSVAGPSVVTLDATLSAGTYTYTVSGGKCSFTLTVTAPAG